jgi:hypothetical protein
MSCISIIANAFPIHTRDARVVRLGEARPDRFAHLRVDAAERVRMTREKVERPGERVRRGLVSGEEQRDHLVADLLVAHPLPLLVPGAHEIGEEVGAQLEGLPAVRDHLEDEPVEECLRFGILAPAARRQPLQEAGQRHDATVRALDQDRHGGADARGLATNVDTEERGADDPQRPWTTQSAQTQVGSGFPGNVSQLHVSGPPKLVSQVVVVTLQPKG